jgi:hypothetical protein
VEQFLVSIWQQESDQSELIARLCTLKRFESVSIGSADATDQIVFSAMKMKHLPFTLVSSGVGIIDIK